MDTSNVLYEWAARNHISFVTRSDGMRTTETVSRGALMELIESATLRDELAEVANEALNVLIGCCIPAGGADDRAAILDAQSSLRAVLAKYEASK